MQNLTLESVWAFVQLDHKTQDELIKLFGYNPFISG